jgi:O-succinylbenzoate synthase
VLRDFLLPSVLGREWEEVAGFVAASAAIRGHMMAKAALEAAAWDAFAKSRGMSLAAMLGGTRERIDVGVAIGMQPSEPALLRRVAEYVGEGYRRVKIKIAPGADVGPAAAVRGEFPGLALQVDGNCAYSLADLPVFRALDDLGLLLVEQPLGCGDLVDHARLQREIRTPVCLDESIESLADVRSALALGSCRIVTVKPGRVGGFSEARLIHDECARLGVPVWHGGMLETGIGRAGNVALASLPNFTLPADISGSRRYYREDIVEPPFEVAPDGTMQVPTAPGIGVEVLEDRLDRATLRREEFR